MNLDEMGSTEGLLSQFQKSVDDPLVLIFVLGLGAIVVMAVLLRFSFYSMQRADKRRLQQDHME